MSFRNRLIASILLVSVLPLIFATFFSYRQSVKSSEDQMVKYSTRLAQNSLSNFNIAIKGASNAVLDMLSSPELNKLLRNIKNEYSEYDELSLSDKQILDSQVDQIKLKVFTIYSINSSMFENILIFADNIKVPVIYAGTFDIPDIYKRVEQQKGKLCWMLERNGSAVDKGNYNIYLAGAVLNISDNKVIGEVCVRLSKEYINCAFGDARKEDGEYSLILTPDNKIVMHPDQGFVGENYSNVTVLNEVEIYKNGNKIMNVEGSKYVVTYATSEENGWKLINLIPYKNITKKSLENTKTIINITVISALTAIALSVILSLSMYHPVSRLRRAMNQVDKGNLDINVEIKTKDEFGMLGESFNKLMKRIKALIVQVQLEQTAKKEAEMSALRAQVNPHFLYNTLNVIKCMAGSNDMNGIEQVTVGLIDLLRISIGDSRDVISIQEEIKYVKSYIKIQKYRMDKEFEFIDEISDKLYSYQIPKFTLQPVVENAIIHGFKGSMSGNIITMKGCLKDDMILIEVMDNGKGMSGEKQENLQKYLDNPGIYRFNKVGIVNVSERIKLQYGQKYGIQVQSFESEGTRICISIPAVAVEKN